MGSAGMRVIAVVALSGCSLLLMTLRRRWLLGGGRKEKKPAGSSRVVYSLKSLSCEASDADAGLVGRIAGVVEPPPPAKSSSGACGMIHGKACSLFFRSLIQEAFVQLLAFICFRFFNCEALFLRRFSFNCHR